MHCGIIYVLGQVEETSMPQQTEDSMKVFFHFLFESTLETERSSCAEASHNLHMCSYYKKLYLYHIVLLLSGVGSAKAPASISAEIRTISGTAFNFGGSLYSAIN